MFLPILTADQSLITLMMQQNQMLSFLFVIITATLCFYLKVQNFHTLNWEKYTFDMQVTLQKLSFIQSQKGINAV